MGQADAYSAKSWGHLVAPTNRRPYGFDWEDWGRLDAMEVLAHAQNRLGTDPSRTYLTGHSMGGHGTWHVGVTFPDRFAAIGPSAGWISMWSYAGAVKPNQTSPLQELLSRAMAPSDTLALAHNYAQHGVYVLHGSADDNVPANQARQMKEVLEKFHRDFAYYEQPGAGHWWDASDEPGADCVDWAPMFDFFARRVVPPPEAVRQVDFTTANPGASARSHWVSVEAQQKALRPSRVQLRCDPGARRFSGTTDNVARLALDVRHLAPGAPLAVHLDGQKLDGVAWPEKGKLWAQKEGERWAVVAEPSRARKGPHRAGPFKDAFRHRMLFVYGTRGDAAENAWALARARYDAETFWYRGNGSVDVIADRDFDPAATRDRGVILYGHAEMNGAWQHLLAGSPVQVRRGVVTVGEREEKGDDLACLFLRPRPGSDTASVGVIAGTGLAGLRVTERLPYFVSGVAYPDWVVLGLDALEKGIAGVRGTGYFGDDWGVATGESAWQPSVTR
jgi:dienelactone hydrolase